MKKIGRNTPCPCGSGKKYKNCCEPRNKINSLDDQVNMDLHLAHQTLISFVKDKYNYKIDEQYARFGQAFALDYEAREIHRTGLMPWIMTSIPCLSKNQTIFQQFLQTNQKKIQPHARTIMEQWQNSDPAVYEVISTDASEGNYNVIKELDGDDTYYIPNHEDTDIVVGSLLIGVLVPFTRHHEFMLTMLKLVDVNRDDYEALIKKHKETYTDINAAFPTLLANILTYQPGEEVTESKPANDESSVEGLLSRQLANEGFDNQTIQESLSKWQTFCEKENPTIIKMEPYAAAMEYYTRKDMLGDESVTQPVIAKKYGASASSLSKNYRWINKVL